MPFALRSHPAAAEHGQLLAYCNRSRRERRVQYMLSSCPCSRTGGSVLQQGIRRRRRMQPHKACHMQLAFALALPDSRRARESVLVRQPHLPLLTRCRHAGRAGHTPPALCSCPRRERMVLFGNRASSAAAASRNRARRAHSVHIAQSSSLLRTYCVLVSQRGSRIRCYPCIANYSQSRAASMSRAALALLSPSSREV